MDMAMNTPGLNMAATTLIGFVRTPILQALTKRGAARRRGCHDRALVFCHLPLGQILDLSECDGSDTCDGTLSS